LSSDDDDADDVELAHQGLLLSSEELEAFDNDRADIEYGSAFGSQDT
jgi:hypothetical protein